MKIRACARLAAWVVLSVFVVAAPAGVVAAEAGWQAGAAKVSITPDRSMWMAGYGSRTTPAEGKATELWAKALVLQDAAGNRAAMITLDLVGIDRTLGQDVVARLEKQHGLKRDQIAMCTSHTHCGPVVGLNLPVLHYELVDQKQRRLIEQYAEQLKTKIVGVVTEAIENLEPAQITWGSGRTTFAVNRRENNPRDNVPAQRREDTLKGPSDHDVPVLAVHNAEGELRAVAFGYACHATTLSYNLYNGDYPGYAQSELEALHPGAVALFWAGCGADQNPLPRRTEELAEHYGRRLATAVDTVLLTSRMLPVDANLQTRYEEIPLPLDTLPQRDQLQQDTHSKNPYTAARAKMLLRQLDAGKQLAETYPYPVQLWKLGDDVQFVTLGGEVVVDYALRLKSELRGEQTWVAGYANDVMAYIPSRRVLQEGGYEGGGAMVYYGLPTVWAPEVEELIVRQVRALAE